MRNFLSALYNIGGYLSGFFLVAIFILMMVLSLGRPFGINIPSGDDFAAWSMAAMAFLGLAHTFKEGQMIRVGLLIDKFTGKTRWAFEIFSLVIALFFVGFFSYHTVMMLVWSYKLNDMSQGIVSIPLWIPQIGMALGLVLLFIALCEEFIVTLFTGEMPSYDKGVPQTDEERLQRAIETSV